MREKTVLVLSIIIASGLGVSTAIFGVVNMNSVNSYNTLMDNYQNLTEDYNELNKTYYILADNYTKLQGDYNNLDVDHTNLIINYNELQENYTDLQSQYDALLNDYQNLLEQYEILSDAYDDLSNKYNALKTYISNLILPAQYLVFAEAVRRYYIDIYLNDSLTTKEWYMGYAEFCRDIALHDSEQYNAFSEVSNAFSDALTFGNDTMNLTHYIMCYPFYPWLPYWGADLTFDELWGIDTVVDWCIDEIDYEYDSDITLFQEDPTWDYPKFPVETAFRTMGDCEDQAILVSAYLESCGFETAITIFHDPSHPTYGAFYHGVSLIHIEDISAFESLYPGCSLWNLGGIDPYEGFSWCWLDTTWDVPFGSEPSWLQDYKSTGMSWDIMSIALCDIDGVIGENIGLTCVISDQ